MLYQHTHFQEANSINERQEKMIFNKAQGLVITRGQLLRKMQHYQAGGFILVQKLIYLTLSFGYG